MADKQCGCDDYNRTLASRRSFLKGLGVVAGGGMLASMHGTVFRQTAFAATGSADHVLVVLSLRGGVDGMSLVVPHGDPWYCKCSAHHRRTTSELLEKDAMFGLHPNLAPLAPMWRAGQMAAVQAVGLPVPNRSHFSAMEEVEEADPGAPERIGWLNRMVGMSEPELALRRGPGRRRRSAHADLRSAADPRGHGHLERSTCTARQTRWPQRKAALDITWRHVHSPLASGTRDAMKAADEWSPVRDSPADPQHGAKYPHTGLGEALAQSARLIRADVGAEVVTVDHGSWDMHTDLGTLDWGEMRLMIDDLAAVGRRLLHRPRRPLRRRSPSLTISEFGRRVARTATPDSTTATATSCCSSAAGSRAASVYGKWPGLARLAPDERRSARRPRTTGRCSPRSSGPASPA